MSGGGGVSAENVQTVDLLQASRECRAMAGVILGARDSRLEKTDSFLFIPLS